MLTSNDELQVWFPIEPVPASRPRVSSYGHAYYSPKYKNWLKDAQDRAEVIGVHNEPLTGPLSVTVHCFCVKPKTGKLAFPKGDLDNYAKGPLDVLTKLGVWEDDSQIVRLTVTKRYSTVDQAGTQVIIKKGGLSCDQ